MKSNIVTRKLVSDLKKAGVSVPLWKRIAKDLEKPTRSMCRVNIEKLEKNIKEGEVALVPGKVLSVGTLSKKLTIAAHQFSQAAKIKINEKGKAISIRELLEKNPKGKKVRIIQ
jgi:large subunit ribosomal protein L18e